MRNFIVVEDPKRWPLDPSHAEVVEARAYLTEPRYQGSRRISVYNFCRSFAYQTVGYYVSLLAAARGHRPLPSVDTLGDLKMTSVLKIVSDQLVPLLEQALSDEAVEESSEKTLSFYFGRHPDPKYRALAQAIFEHFPVPLLKARFRQKRGVWFLESLRPLAGGDVPAEHTEFLLEKMKSFFAHPRRPKKRKEEAVYSIAILVNPKEAEPPSDQKALEKFQKAARELRMEAVVIEPSDMAHLAEFDGLFVRETTSVNHHTYQFARRAEAEGMVVIDDSESIMRCCNKAFQAELFERHKIPCPPTLLVSRQTPLERIEVLGFPCVVKVPDSSFCRGVTKADDRKGLKAALDEIFKSSELAVVQSFTPSGFDWRIGVLDRGPLFACRYAMAKGHWQVYHDLPDGKRSSGKVECVPIEQAPPLVIDVALSAANLIGDGLYGVDVKEIDGKVLVIEVNDNPSVEADEEDQYLKDELYLSIMRAFWTRLERKRRDVIA